MMLDGHTAASIAERLGISSSSLLYNWKHRFLAESGPVATSLEERVRQLETELLRVERERDILKKALAIFGRSA
jgi:transposase